jgi:hypothetical protein
MRRLPYSGSTDRDALPAGDPPDVRQRLSSVAHPQDVRVYGFAAAGGSTTIGPSSSARDAACLASSPLLALVVWLVAWPPDFSYAEASKGATMM